MFCAPFPSLSISQEEVVTAAMAEVVTRPGGQAGREAADKEDLRQAIESEYLHRPPTGASGLNRWTVVL